jgi:hypothetical protein
MFRSGRRATDADLAILYREQFRRLWALARELKIPRTAAAEVIDQVLVATLLRKLPANPEAWLDATLRAAAKQYREQGG